MVAAYMNFLDLFTVALVKRKLLIVDQLCIFLKMDKL